MLHNLPCFGFRVRGKCWNQGVSNPAGQGSGHTTRGCICSSCKLLCPHVWVSRWKQLGITSTEDMRPPFLRMTRNTFTIGHSMSFAVGVQSAICNPKASERRWSMVNGQRRRKPQLMLRWTRTTQTACAVHIQQWWTYQKTRSINSRRPNFAH